MIEKPMENYLDITRSVIISSPAGSGKTEKLARRYISLLEGGSRVEKILCITFTEKAAAEMKERILGILSKEDPSFLATIRPRIPLMRISTIHSFCLKVLKRFAIELGIDPAMSVMDEHQARNLWTESVYETLMSDAPGEKGKFFQTIKDRGLRGWNVVKRHLDVLHAKSPYPELLLAAGDRTGEADEEALKLLEIYGECLDRYRKKKLERRTLDFNDLEVLAYRALSLGPEAQNILYSFDEHTDHVLVDEFQDTGTLQWKIIEQLTEEWRAGLGAKRERGHIPTIFLVGDEKQSIYLFRGANVGIFHEAKEQFAEWMGEEFTYVEARENYRSLPAIISFTNRLFEKLMPPALLESWKTRYSPFQATRKGEGEVHLLLLGPGENTRDARMKEARALARAMNSLAGRHEIYDGEEKRKCEFADMAVLLRKRTHLAIFEDALRREGIPFIVVKGIGFYDEPETALLREFLSFLADPRDDYSLFCLLRSPLFGIDIQTLARLARGRSGILKGLRRGKAKKFQSVSGLLDEWLAARGSVSLSVLLERLFIDTKGWAFFRERQRHANIKKFISMVEGYEASGFSLIEIREKLIRQRHATEEPKANVNAEGMNAVRVMTIHAAKGLQFPMVFLPSLDERNVSRSGPIVFDDSGGRIRMAFQEDSRKRNKDERFALQKLKEEEEEKRLFYVAVTRARDYLLMVSSPGEKTQNTRHGYLEDCFGLNSPGLPFTVIREEDVPSRFPASPFPPDTAEALMRSPAYTGPIEYHPGRIWRDVTEDEAGAVRRRHGENWVLMGTLMHRLFEELSQGTLKEKDLEGRARFLLRSEAGEGGALIESVMTDVEKLRKSGIMEDIITPRDNAYAELPFVLERGKQVLNGRIDRVILETGAAHVYDYKTFPVKSGEIPGLMDEYRFQMDCYSEAVEKLFSIQTRAYLVFTHVPKIVEIKRTSLP
jgi:ATP-dependent helicase/nuclease subunit A